MGPASCSSWGLRRHQQDRNEDKGDGKARPPEFAKFSATAGDGEARPLEGAKHTATIADGEAPPPEAAKYGAVTADDTAVAKADARPLEIAKFGEG